MSRDAGCERVRPLLFALLEEELGRDERADLAAHLAVCEACREALMAERALTRLLLQAARVRMPWRWRGTVRYASVAAVILLAVVASMPLWYERPAYGSITTRTLTPLLIWEAGGTQALEASNHVAVLVGSAATVELEGTATLRALGEAVFELDWTAGRWKLSVHRGQLEVNVQPGAQVVAASIDGVQTLSSGRHLIAADAVASADEESEAGPDQPSELMVAALEEFREWDDMARAERLLERVLQHPKLTKQQRSDALFYLAAAEGNQKKYAEHLATLEVWLAENPHDPARDVALFWKGRALWELGEKANAEAVWDDVLREYPNTNARSFIEAYRTSEKRAAPSSQPAGGP